jgi:ribosome-binding factor A
MPGARSSRSGRNCRCCALRTERYAESMPQGSRVDRVGEEFREILAAEIQKLKDPRLGFVTVTGVKVSHDLRHAWIYYTSLGDDQAKRGTRAALQSAGRRLRHELGRQIRLKVTPELEFVHDDTSERGDRIDAIIEQIKRGGEVQR